MASSLANRGKMKIGLGRSAALTRLITVLAFLCLPMLRAQTKAPRFEVDPAWPKPLPNLWVTGGIGGVCIDSRDHVFVLNRRDLTDNDLDAGHQAPVVIEFDPDGNVVNSFGDPNATPDTPHGCAIDSENNVWITGTGDGIIQKFSHDGSKLLLQIGRRGVVDSSDGTAKGKPLNSSHDGFFKPAGIAIDPKNDDVYVADGESPGGNHRVVVFDRTGKFLRQWELHRAETETGDAFVPVLHCVTMDDSGWVYVCDRRAHRIQVFNKTGEFLKNIPVEWSPMSAMPAGPGHESGGLGSAVWIEFSRDAGQKYMYVVNQDNEKVDILDRASGNLLSSFGRAGRQPGEFTYAHFLAVDSKGNLYVTEVGTGKRIQKFKFMGVQ
jgi:DNA-binding beta-propeller fold protein YncE